MTHPSQAGKRTYSVASFVRTQGKMIFLIFKSDLLATRILHRAKGESDETAQVTVTEIGWPPCISFVIVSTPFR